MKTLSIVAIVAFALLLTACDVERKDANTVEISTDTAATAAAAEQTRDAAQATETALRDAAQATETAVRDAAQATETAAREGARQTGTALEEAGKDIQKHSKPGNQP